MRIIANTGMVLWALGSLRPIAKNKRNIDRYRQEGNKEAEKAEILQAEKTWGSMICKKYGIEVRVTGGEDLPPDPVVYVSNHQGYCDIVAFLVAIPGRSLGFVAKEELSRIPLYGRWIKRVRSVFIPRDNVRGSLLAIEEAIENLKEGFSMVIFPEGTRSLGENMGEFKRGSLRLATKSGVPVIPVTINGSYKAFEEAGRLRPAVIDFHIHQPIETKDLSRAEANELPAKVEEIIRGGLKEKVHLLND
ncbi:MAG: lysophospholipid acyltransferase family protein [Anaerovoracaceae bacterium]|jgi:1-acyl-sn-glycerol-3-phosphate acyltransferase